MNTTLLKTVQSLLAMALALSVACAHAQQASREQIKGLDEQVQDIKKDVLAISSELQQLEEKLLYPSNTQVSVFVSLAPGAALRLDAIKLRIDGKDVAHHIYTFKELEALKAGGVQRVHTGNVRGGEHSIEVELIGKNGSSEFRHNANHRFSKAAEPKLLEIVVAGAQAVEFKD